MKQIYAVILATLTIAGTVRANNNEPAPAPAHTTRQWQKEDDRIIGHIRNSRLTAMKSTSASIISLFQDSVLTDAALNPVWHGEYFPAVNGQVRFGVRCMFDNNNDLTVFANDLSPLLGHLTVNGKDFTTMKAPKTENGKTYFEFDLQNDQHVKAWLITGDSAALPYIPVTRKEYLEEARKELESMKDVVIADVRGKVHVRTDAEQEAEKQQMLEQLKSTYSGAELETRTRIYLHNYMKDADLLIQTIARDVAGYTETIKFIDKLLHNSTAQQLAQPAIVSKNAADFRGFEDGQANTTMLVRLNNAYFTGNDEQAPKCLLVCWRFNPTETTANGIDHQLAANFQPAQLQTLLAK